MRKCTLKKSKATILENTINIFAWVSFFVAILMAVTTFFASMSGEQNGKDFFGTKLLIVTSDSMSKSALSENEEIFFDAGDLIIIKNIDDPMLLNVGDVITYISYSPESYGKTVTHKIREIRYNTGGEISGFVTYGINTGKNDTVIVRPESIVGRYCFKIPSAGKIFAFLKTPRGYYASILTPCVLLIIFFSVKMGRVMGKKDFAESYNEELEALKNRVTALEKRELSAEAMGSAIPQSKVPTATDTAKPSYIDTENSTEADEADEPVEEMPETRGPIIPRGRKISFSERILNLDEKVQEWFNLIHNELISYKRVNPRLSFRCMSYRCGRRLLAKMSISGKTLRLHLDLDIGSFNEKAFFQRDLSSVKAFEDVPFTIKVKSPRGSANAIRLIGALAGKHGLTRSPKFEKTDAFNALIINNN